MSTARIESGFEAAKYIEERSSKTNEVKQYIKGKFLGKGGFAKCYEFTIVDTKSIVASKVIPKATLTKSRAKQKLMSEIKIHRSLNHTNIVGFTHFFEDYENVYILLELCTNQTMNELIRRRKRLTELEVQCYMVQILSALKYLHKHRVIHRDLKLGNLFLSDKMEIKLGDFGLATKLEYDGERKRTICGTPNYIAPEILEGSKRGHSYEVDVWSVGVIMYTLLIGKPPFETNDVKTTYRRIKMNAYSFPEHVIISSQAKDIVTRILQTDPSKRPTVDEIMDHAFFNHGGSIPKLLPISTLACPPSASYVRQFLPQSQSLSKNSPRKLESTAPVNPSNPYLKERKDFINTDRCPAKPLNQFDLNNINNQAIKKDLKNQHYSSNGDNNAQQQQQPGSNQQENVNSIRNSLDKFTYLKMSQKNAMTEANLNTKQANFPTQPSSSTNLNNQLSTNNTAGNNLMYQSSEIWVKKWVDYSAKYGLGYLLSTGAAGAFFNDSTKIILDKDGNKFEYIERRGSDREDIVTTHTLTDYPSELQKKITLLKHFKNYLEGEKQKDNNNNDAVPAKDKGSQNQSGSNNTALFTSKQAKNIYVKKWLKTKHAIMFRLSNKVVQVIFQDQTEIILSSELKIVTYVNKKQERLTFPLANALESSNQEMAKRLKYTKDILTHMLGNQGNQQQQQQTSSSQQQQSQQQNQQVQPTMPLQQKAESSLNLVRTNKHASQGNSHEKHAYGGSLNKYTPSVDNKLQYASNPIYNSLGKHTKTTYNDENENIPSQISSRIQKQQSTNGFNLTGSGFNGAKQGYDNLQLLKSQSTAGRMSGLNLQTNNFIGIPTRVNDLM